MVPEDFWGYRRLCITSHAFNVVVTVRTEPSKPSNVLEFDFSVQVPSIVLEFNSMFSNVLETKCLENAVILAGILALLA